MDAAAFDPFDAPEVGARHHGKVVLLTGAAGGIGRASATRLAAEGASLWCADIDHDGARETAMAITARGGSAEALALDVTDPDGCAQAVATVTDADEGLDVLCNVAGVGGSAHSLEETPERFSRMLAVNAAGPFHLSQAALPHLLERRGTIVNVASTAGIIGQAYCAAYCASKHALVGLTKSLALEYGRAGLRVNAVCPGGVNTDLLTGFQPPEGASMSLIARSFLNREMQEPESVAALIAYVSSDEAYYVNGAVIAVDGGTTAG